MNRMYPMLRVVIFSLGMMALTVPVFGQQSAVATSVWNGGFGPWNTPVDWVTNGSLALTTPNNGDIVLCSVGGVLESCSGYFNVSIGTGGFDLATLDQLPVKIDSLVLGASTGSAALDIGSSVADTLTLGDPTAPNGGAAASLTVNSTGLLNVFPGSKLGLNIASGNGTVTNNGAIDLQAASGTGSSLLIDDAGNAHQLTLTGTGALTMQAGSVVQGGKGDETLINGSTIQGRGTISGLTFVNSGTLAPNGTLIIKPNLNSFTEFGVGPNAFAFLNFGSVSIASGNTLVLDTSTSPSVGFQSVNEGTIGVNGGTLEFIGRADATTLINNPGEISVGDSGNGLVKLDGSNAVFDLFPNGATGTLTLSDNPGNVIEGVTGTETLINGSGETVSGAGTIKNLALTNNGTIIASGTNALNIIPNAAGYTNNGTLQVNSGSALNLSGTTMSTNSATLTVDGTLNLTSGSTLGFSIAGSNGAVTNNGAMNLNSATLAINDGGNGHMLTLAGDGALTLSDNPANMISGSHGDETLVIGSGQTLRGSGTFSNLAVVLDGQVEATAVNALNFKPNAGGVTNNGIFNIFSGARVNVTGTLMNTNFIELVGGGPRTDTLNVTGKFTNAGAIQIQDANTANVNTLVNAGFAIINEGAALNLTGASNSSSSGHLLLTGGAINGTGGLDNTGLLESGQELNATTTPPSTISLANTFTNSGTIQVDSGMTLKTVLTAGASATGLSNPGTITVANGGTFVVGLAHTTRGTGFSNSGTVNVSDGGTLLLQNLNHGTTSTINNFQGRINIGQSTGATVVLNDGGGGATFNLIASSGALGQGTVTLANSTIKGMAGDETLVNGFANTIEGTGTISHLILTNKSNIVANGGMLEIGAELTNLKGGTLTGGEFEAGHTAPGRLQLPGDVTTNSAFLILDGADSAINDPNGKNALAGVSANVNGGNIAIDGGASLTINHSLTNGSPSSASGLIQLHNGGALTINGNLTNWDQIPTGFSEDGPGGNNTLDVTGEVINNFRSGPVQDFVELEGSGDVLKAGLFQNSATVRIGQGAKITVGGSYTQTGGETDVAGTLMSPAITVMGGTLASGGGIVEMKTLTSGASITTDSTGFIGVGSGTFTATHGYQQVADGTLDELISSKSAFGVINVTGPVSLNGTLDVVLQKGFVPTVGEQFAFMDFTKGDLTGKFANFLGQTFDKGQEDWDITYNNAIGEVLLTAGSTAPCNAVLAVGASSSDCGPSPTPEPASLLLLGTGLLGLGLGLRKKTGAAPAVRNPSRWQARRIVS